MYLSGDKNIQTLAEQVIASGLVTPVRGTKHMALVRADGHKMTIPGSPSDHRAYMNWRSDIRRFVPEAFVKEEAETREECSEQESTVPTVKIDYTPKEKAMPSYLSRWWLISSISGIRVIYTLPDDEEPNKLRFADVQDPKILSQFRVGQEYRVAIEKNQYDRYYPTEILEIRLPVERGPFVVPELVELKKQLVSPVPAPVPQPPKEIPVIASRPSSVDALDLEEQQLLARLESIKVQKAQALELAANRVKWETDLSYAQAKVMELEEAIKAQRLIISDLSSKLHVGPKAVLPSPIKYQSMSKIEPLCQAAYDDPVRFSSGGINVRATATKHRLSQGMFTKWMRENHPN